MIYRQRRRIAGQTVGPTDCAMKRFANFDTKQTTWKFVVETHSYAVRFDVLTRRAGNVAAKAIANRTKCLFVFFFILGNTPCTTCVVWFILTRTTRARGLPATADLTRVNRLRSRLSITINNIITFFTFRWGTRVLEGVSSYPVV